MGEVATLLDILGVGSGVIFAVGGAYLAVQARLGKLESTSERWDEKFSSLTKDVSDMDASVKWLEKREHRRDGAKMARSEQSDVTTLPRRRVHLDSDKVT